MYNSDTQKVTNSGACPDRRAPYAQHRSAYGDGPDIQPCSSIPSHEGDTYLSKPIFDMLSSVGFCQSLLF